MFGAISLTPSHGDGYTSSNNNMWNSDLEFELKVTREGHTLEDTSFISLTSEIYEITISHALAA